MADGDIPEPGERVEVVLAVGVDDLGALAAHDDHWRGMIGRVVERVDQVLAIRLEELGDIDRFGRSFVRGLNHGVLLWRAEWRLPAV